MSSQTNEDDVACPRKSKRVFWDLDASASSRSPTFTFTRFIVPNFVRKAVLTLMTSNVPAMATTPWTVTSSKRRSTPTTFTGRKRQRRDDTPSRPQQTLTQAQWVSRPQQSFDESDMNPIESTARPVKAERLRKRNATLTQMDFFATPTDQVDEDALRMIQEPKTAAARPFPQVDGTYESPRRKRKRKPPPTLKKESTESQEYQPQKSRKVVFEHDANPLNLRRSTRKAATRSTVLSDPVDNLEYFNQALACDATPRVQPRFDREIQDSTEDGDIFDMSNFTPHRGPQTPTKAITCAGVIKSSQSPDSVPPSTERSTRSDKLQQGRLPLSRRSGNARESAADFAPPLALYGKENASQGTDARLKRRKQQRTAKVENSQTNVWSIQPTSSPSKRSSEAEIVASISGATSRAREASSSIQTAIEIPSTSQIDAASTLPDPEKHVVEHGVIPDTLDAMPRSSQHRQDETASEPQAGASAHVVGESDQYELAPPFCTKSAVKNDAGAKPAPDTPKPSRPYVADSEDAYSEFGSPILNDTQYNEEIKQRTSSPGAAEEPEADHESATGASQRSPIPTPRLVRQSSPLQRIDSDSSSSGLSLPPPPPPTANPFGITKRVPLNDILPSSSPPLPSTRSATQRSVGPASMPHPSQISTQEATQGYAGSSYMPFETPRTTQRVTIKDSSSMRMPMSQIPPQPSQSQLDIDLGLDAFKPGEEEDEDYDLDPPSSAVQPQHEAAKKKASSPEEIPAERIVPSSSSPSPSPRPSARIEMPDKRSPNRPEISTSKSPVHSPAPLPPLLSDSHDMHDADGDLNPASSPSQHYSPSQPALAKPLDQYTQIPGFNNETQSNFTQGGHVSAAYVHRQREAGVLPKWYTPKPYKVPGYTRR